MLRVLILYEDFTIGRRAIDTYNSMIAQLGGAFEFHNSVWKFDLLGQPKLREIAASDAAEAELIIVAACSDALLPDEVRLWMEGWVPRRGGRGGALAVLVDRQVSPGAEVSPAFDYLKGVAMRARMDFLPSATLAVSSSAEAGGPVASSPVDVPRERGGQRRWGLNE